MQNHRTATAFLLALVLSIGFLARPIHAADVKPSTSETITQRVTGLFAPDREADLRTALQEIPGVELVSLDFNLAEATFRYDPTVAFPGAKPADAPKRLAEKLRSASNSTFNLQLLDPSIAKDQLTRVEIPIAGLDCRACSLAAYEIVAKIEGVYAATASFHDRKATALIDPKKTNRESIIAALTKRNVSVSETYAPTK